MRAKRPNILTCPDVLFYVRAFLRIGGMFEMTIDVYTFDGTPAGSIDVTPRGPRTVFEYAGGKAKGVMRLTLLGGGAALPLGIPAPEGGGLRLRRTLTRLELGGFALDGAVGVLAELDADLSGFALPAACPPESAAITDSAVGDTEPVSAGAASESAATPPESSGEAESGQKDVPVTEDSKCDAGTDAAEGPEAAPEKERACPEAAELSECAPETAPHEPETATPEAAQAEADEKTEAAAGADPAHALGRLAPAPEDGWYLEPDPGRHINSPELREAASRAGEAWVRFEGADTLLAFPWTPSQPFPMIPIFRLGAAGEMAGRGFIIFRLRDGEPI